MALTLSAASHFLCSSTRLSLSPAVASSSSSSSSSSSPLVTLSSSSSPHSLSSLRSIAFSSLFPHSFLVQRKHQINGTNNGIVSPKCAASDAHTLGRARPDRSGWGKPETKYTKTGPGEAGGQSWTVKWLKFDNSYFKDIKEKMDEDLLVLPTDAALFEDPSFKNYAEKYAEDPAAFFKDYAEAHAKLSNLGAKFDPPEGIIIDNAPEKFVAAKYSTGKKELSDSMKQKIRAEYEAIGGSPDKHPLITSSTS